MSGSVKVFGFKEAHEALEEEILDMQDKASIQVVNGVSEKMPVDTGRARGGTQTKMGSPHTNDPNRPDKTGQLSLIEAQSALETLKLGDDVFVSNNVEYVSFLEDGSSQQAPKGMFQLTVDEVAGQFN